jgi:hypothetical protein
MPAERGLLPARRLSVLFTPGIAAFKLQYFAWLQVFPFRVFPLLLRLRDPGRRASSPSRAGRASS